MDVKALTADIFQSYTRPESIFEFEGYDIRWSGWRVSPLYIVKFGYWIAHRPRDGSTFYSTIFGVVGKITDPMQQLDITLDPSMLGVNFFTMTKLKEDQIARQAAWKLLQHLEKEVNAGLDGGSRAMV